MAVTTRPRKRLTPEKAPSEFPRFLFGATDFDTHAATLNPLWVIQTLQQYPQFWDDLRDDTDSAESLFGAKRLPGHWALPYLAFDYSRQPDVRPWWQSAGRQSIACEKNWRMLLPLWRTSPVYLALRHSHDRYERVHHHWRVRYRVASEDHALRPKRRGIEWQQLRANAALIIEWLIINWREGWLPGRRRAPDPDRVVIEDGRIWEDSLNDLRRDLGLYHPYGTKAVDTGIGSHKPVPGKRVEVPVTEDDPSEPEDDVVIPPTDEEYDEFEDEFDLPERLQWP